VPAFCHCLESTAATIRLVSWNVLAPVHAPPSKYPWADPSAVLDWSGSGPGPGRAGRCRRIARLLLEERPDVACLQEVQLADDCWRDLYEGTGLSGLYDAVVQNVTRGHPVANAVLVRRAGNSGDGRATMTIRAVESRSRALLVVLTIEREQGGRGADGCFAKPRPLVLANVHWDAGTGPDREATRFCQVQSLMRRIDHHCLSLVREVEDGGQQETTVPEPAVVVAGDWNTLPGSPLYRLVSTGRLEESDHKGKGSADDPPALPRLRLPLPRLPLRDAFAAAGASSSSCQSGDDEERLTYAGGCVLDYVWVSDNVSVLSARTHPPDDFARATAATSPSGHSRRRRRRHLWPDALHPSDHLAVAATLRLEGREQ
jgi:endonuclease/exonuclease/phosphatase family metal-dependent hydrolase